MADVSEVIDSILLQLGVSQKDLQFKQKQKRDKVGDFKEGIILIDTNNPSPLQRKKANIGDLFKTLKENQDSDFLQADDRIWKNGDGAGLCDFGISIETCRS